MMQSNVCSKRSVSGLFVLIAGKYTLTFNYSLLADNNELGLLVNDKFVPTSLLFTNENNWGSFSVDVELKAGENTIILSNGSSTAVEIDLMTIRK